MRLGYQARGLAAADGAVASIIRRRPFHEHRWVPWAVGLTDLVALEFSAALGLSVLQALGPWLPATGSDATYQDVALGVLLAPIMCLFVGLYPGYLLAPVERLKRKVCVVTGVFATLLIWDYLTEDGNWSRQLLLLTFVVYLVLSPIVGSIVQAILIRANRWGMPVILIGAQAEGQRVAEVLKDSPELGMVAVGFLDDDPAKRGTEIDGVPVLGPLSEAAAWSKSAKLAILALKGATGKRLADLSAELPFARLILVPDLHGLQSLWIEPHDLAGIMALGLRKKHLDRHIRYLKGILEFVASLCLFVVSLPVMVVIAVAIKLDSPGPVLFLQQRLGHGDRRFDVLKFRTMRVGAEPLEQLLAREPQLRQEYRTYHKLRNDPRITAVGKFLRVSTLDELPQLWNVLKGDMSLVGPRPYMPEEIADMKGSEQAILELPPGITGLWQISGRTQVSFQKRLEIDLYYIRNWSLWLDIYILFRTVAAIISRRGAH